MIARDYHGVEPQRAAAVERGWRPDCDGVPNVSIDGPLADRILSDTSGVEPAVIQILHVLEHHSILSYENDAHEISDYEGWN